MDETRHEGREAFECPLGRLFNEIGRGLGKGSDFQKHIIQSRVEFLKAIRSLVDGRIETLEGKWADEGQRVTKIEVE